MKLKLTRSYVLTDEHESTNYGQPVLVRSTTGEAFGPADVLEPYPSWGVMTAGNVVVRIARHIRLTAEERLFIERFNLETTGSARIPDSDSRRLLIRS
jgi:hypothetical protein